MNVEVQITLRTSFDKYEDDESNELAKKQIQLWCEEVLSEDPNIPLFVMFKGGEETGQKEITVSVREVK
jgi:hypothetical protein